MSHYRTVEMKFVDKDLLIEALCKYPGSKWKREHIKYFSTPQKLMGYENRYRQEKAEIIIPKKFVDRASNDIGFAFNPETKTWDVIVSEYDTSIGYNQEWIDKLGITYGMESVKRVCESNGISSEDIEWVKNSDGSVEATIKVGYGSSSEWDDD